MLNQNTRKNKNHTLKIVEYNTCLQCSKLYVKKPWIWADLKDPLHVWEVPLYECWTF